MTFRPLAALTVLTVTAGTALVAAPAFAQTATAPTTLYVSNSTGCSDSPTRTPGQAYCTVQAAADAAQPGQTVLLAPGTHPGAVTLTHSGTPGTPITISGANPNYPYNRGGVTGSAQPAFTLNNVHDIVLASMDLTSSGNVVAINGGSNISLTGDTITDYAPASAGDTAAVSVTQPGSAVQITRSMLRSLYGTGLRVAQGSSGGVLASRDIVLAGGAHGILVNDTTALLVGNTLIGACADQIQLSGASSNSLVDNNIVTHPTSGPTCPAGGDGAQISVSAASVGGTIVNYNLVNPAAGIAPYLWSGTSYDSPSAFNTPTGQGGHDLLADPQLGPDYTPLQGSPAIDSGDYQASGETALDYYGRPIVDDLLTSNTGNFPGYLDRGAVEVQDPYHISLASSGSSGLAPLTETFTATETNPWGTKITGYAFDFGDGSPQQVSTSLTATHVFTTAGTHYVTVTATAADGATYSSGWVSVDVVAPVAPKSSFVPVTPARVVDTRDGTGGHKGPIGANSSLSLKVAGLTAGGTTIPSAGVTAAVFSVTAVNATADSYVSVYGDQDGPGSVTLMTAPKQIVSNLVTVPVKNGVVDFYNRAGSVDVVAVLTGYYSSSQPGGSTFAGMAPTHLLDTRNGTGLAAAGKIGPGGVDTVPVTGGSTGVPGDGSVTAVALDVTAISGTANSFLALYPGDSGPASATSMSFAPGQIIANTMIVPVDSSGSIKFSNHSGYVDATADITGYYRTGTAGSSYVPIPTQHVLDTRSSLGSSGPLGAGATLPLGVTGVGSVPGIATGVVLNVTVLSPTANSYLSIYPDTAKTGASTGLDFATGQSISNMVVVPVVNGRVDLYNHAGNVNVVADILGYYAP